MTALRPLWAVFCACLCVASCQTPPPPATEQEKHAAFEEWLACAKQNVDRLDDRVSDAYTVAVGLAAYCHPEFRRSTALVERGMNNQSRLMFERRIATSDMEARDLTGFVLRIRQARRVTTP